MLDVFYHNKEDWKKLCMSSGRARVCTFLQNIYQISLTNEGERKITLSNWEKRDQKTL